MPLKANGPINFISKLNEHITWSLKLKKKKKTRSPYVALDDLEVTAWTRWASNPSCLAKVPPHLPAHDPPASSSSVHPTCANMHTSWPIFKKSLLYSAQILMMWLVNFIERINWFREVAQLLKESLLFLQKTQVLDPHSWGNSQQSVTLWVQAWTRHKSIHASKSPKHMKK